MISQLAPQGFWGPPTSTVDWCEANYGHTPYIAELFNTLSSAAMIAAGLVGLWLHRAQLERRFLLAYLIVAVVGVGSVAFHGTLRFELQMLDELPMLYSAIVTVYILLENRAAPRFGRWFPALLVAWAVFVTVLSAMPRGQLQFYCFQVSFGSLEFYSLYRVYRIYRVYRRTQDESVRRAYRLGTLSYLVAIAIWFVDLRFCHVVRALPFGIPNPELHAWWHVLVSAGLYLLYLVIAFDRLTTLGLRPQIIWRGIPHVRRSRDPFEHAAPGDATVQPPVFS